MKILIADDNADSKVILRRTLESDGYTVMTASDGAEALRLARDDRPDMIISDILMPGMDGYQLCRLWREDERLAGVPFVFYSASYTDRKDEEFGLGMGAVRFIVKPMDHDDFLKIIRQILSDYKKGLLTPSPPVEKNDEDSFLKGYSARLITQLEKKVRDLEVSNEALRRSEADLRELFESFVRTMVNTLDAKSRWTNGHSRRVAVYAEQIAREIGLGDRETEELRLAALLHDIGKIGLRDSLLDKTEGLTEDEFKTMKAHAALGADLLKDIKQLSNITPAIRHHHERSDGSGYPEGLKGKEIGLYADIIHVADSFDSMTADRPYRHSMGKEYAVSELKRLSGVHFEPEVVDAFLRTLEREARGEKQEKN